MSKQRRPILSILAALAFAIALCPGVVHADEAPGGALVASGGLATQDIAEISEYAGDAKREGFGDLDESAWYMKEGFKHDSGNIIATYLDYAVGRKLMSGYSGSRAGQFGPNDSLSRGMAATIIYRMATGRTAEDTDNDVTARFSDVPRGVWYAAAVKWCSERGIVTGYAGTNRFGPENPITREQLATIIGRYMDPNASAGSDVSRFGDAPSIGRYARAGVAWCNANGVMTGVGATGDFDPQGQATRCQTAKVIAVTARTADEQGTLPPNRNRYAEDAELYSVVIEAYRKVLLSSAKCDNEYVPEVTWDYLHNKKKGGCDNLGYALLDIDSDGNNELLVGEPVSTRYISGGDHVLYGVYKIVDSRPRSLFGAMTDVRFESTLCEVGVIAGGGANGARSWALSYRRLSSSTSTVLLDGVEYDNGTYLFTDGAGNKTMLDATEGTVRNKALEAKYPPATSIAWTPIFSR